MKTLLQLFILLFIMPVFATDNKILLSSDTESEIKNSIVAPKGLIDYVLNQESDVIDSFNDCLQEVGINKNQSAKLFSIVEVNLNSDEYPDYFVRPALKPFCTAFYGAHAFSYWFVTSHIFNNKTSYTMAFKSTSDAVELLPTLSKKYHDIAIYSLSPTEIYKSVFKYNGQTYTAVNCSIESLTKKAKAIKKVACDT